MPRLETFTVSYSFLYIVLTLAYIYSFINRKLHSDYEVETRWLEKQQRITVAFSVAVTNYPCKVNRDLPIT